MTGHTRLFSGWILMRVENTAKNAEVKELLAKLVVKLVQHCEELGKRVEAAEKAASAAISRPATLGR